MKKCAMVLSIMMIAVLVSGCGNKKAVMPQELPALAREFKGMQGGPAKIELAKKIQTLLPTCMRIGSDGQLAKNDVGNPTYVLKLPELFSLLGQPAESGADFCAYNLGKGEKAEFFLLVNIYDDYVSSVSIDAGK